MNEEVTFDEKMVLDNIAKHVEDGDLDPLAHGLLRLFAICIEREEDSRIAARARAELAKWEQHRFRMMREAVEGGEGFTAAKARTAALDGKIAVLKCIIDGEE